jgi:two-component system chemotaxis family response regulator WspR
MKEQNFEYEEDLIYEKTIKVLLIDDQAMVAEGIKRMLADEEDIEFHYCQDPSKAISTASELAPTVILQDLVLPDIDGMTLVRFYRGNDATKDIPIIVLSSKEDPAVKKEAFQYGANDYLVKLPDKIELIARIRSHAKHYLLQLERNAAFFALREMQKQLQKTNAELERLSSLDGLTGIANRRTFDEALNSEWQRALHEQTALTLILIDIDYFKPYNDTYGHVKGDECLTAVAKTLDKLATRPADLLARYGGEEFVLIAPMTNADGASRLAEILQQGISEMGLEHKASEVSDKITISQGIVTLVPNEKLSSNELIKFADEALYQAKESGRNRHIVYQAD